MDLMHYWNSVADQKTFTTPFSVELFSKYVSSDAIILDVGCGYGRIMNILYSAGYKNLIGLDFSEEMITRGKLEYPHLDFRMMTAGKLDMPDRSCDAVMLMAVLTCIPSNEQQVRLVQDIERVLKPGGIFYVTDFLLNTDARNLQRYEKYFSTHTEEPYGIFEIPEGVVLRHHQESWFSDLFRSFTPLISARSKFKTMNGHESDGLLYIGKKHSVE